MLLSPEAPTLNIAARAALDGCSKMRNAHVGYRRRQRHEDVPFAIASLSPARD